MTGSEKECRAYFERKRVMGSFGLKVVDFGTNRKHVCNFLLVAVSLSGNIVGRINEVTLRRIRLLLRWATVR